LEFTWYWHTTPERESFIRINFKPNDAGTMMTFIHEQFFDQAACDGHTKGWTMGLAKLEAFLDGSAA
ncbi:MAG: SRPBCC domain-containing protein, partial [Rhodospirillaceae bacterium]|nr:SRPBCC domain-containing protein [Rhodospirillaceae bacterium]